jgi:hypothetical protein
MVALITFRSQGSYAFILITLENKLTYLQVKVPLSFSERNVCDLCQINLKLFFQPCKCKTKRESHYYVWVIFIQNKLAQRQTKIYYLGKQVATDQKHP